MYAEAAGFGFGGYSPGLSPQGFPLAAPPMAQTVPAALAAAEAAAGVGQFDAGLPLIAEQPELGAHLGNMVPPTMIAEYDLEGEGDLFKAPESIIEEPLLSLDPVAAAISMISGSENAINETIKVADIGAIQNDPLLSDVFYECEKELLEKSAIEETISELLDVKIPLLQVEEAPRQVEVLSMEKQRSVPEGALQKSVSSGSLNSTEWIGGPVRPNFLVFQGLDLEAAFGMRRAYSEGDIQNLGAGSTGAVNTAKIQASCERLVTINDLKIEERKQKLSRYRKKKDKRNFGRKIKYACRKALADSQPRVRGRFAKIEECYMLKERK